MEARRLSRGAAPTGKVFLVGAGPGDPGLLTLKAARALASADVLVYDALAAAPIVALAPPACERIYVGKRAKTHTLSQEEITKLLVRLGREGKRVVRLKGGDPFVFGRGGEEAQELHAAGVAFEIVPGITSAIAAPAYAGIPVTHRDYNTSFVVATGHEDPAKGASTLDFSKLAAAHQTLIFLMAMETLAGIAARLRANGLPGETPVAIVRNGTTPAQQTLVATLETVAGAVERTGFAAPAIVVVGEVVRLREDVRWFDRSPLFGKRVLVTRPQGQADEFAARLWEAGAEPVLAPTIAVGPPDDLAGSRAAVARIREYAWVVFTSRNGVDTFFDELARTGGDARRIGGTRVAAIGPKTADALAARGIRVDFVPPRYVSEEVADGLLARSHAGEPILLFRAQEARDALPQALRSHGRPTDVVAAYKTVLIEDPRLPRTAAACDVWTFTSASTVRGFARNLGSGAVLADAASGKQVACIGPVTAEAAREAGLPVDVVADDYTADGLLEALERVAATAEPASAPSG